METIIYAVPAAALVGLAFGAFQARKTARAPAGAAEMQAIAQQVQEGAMAFLKREHTVLAGFVAVVAVLLAVSNLSGDTQHPLIALSFVLGAVASGAAGIVAMKLATLANVRTTQAAKQGFGPAFDVAFGGSTAMGMAVSGIALGGLASLFIVYTTLGEVLFAGQPLMATAINALTGFLMGASSVALFTRLGGGVFANAANIGADLVGQVEAGLSEDDPRNPAVLADTVGDNVNSVAGMSADLFESYVAAILGTMLLGLGFQGATSASFGPVVLPMTLAAAGIFCSMAGSACVRVGEESDARWSIGLGTLVSALVMAACSFALAFALWPEGGAIASANGQVVKWWQVGITTVVGLACGLLVGLVTNYYRSMASEVAEPSRSGAAPAILAGVGVGMRATAVPILLIVTSVVACGALAGLYGIAMAALGMLSTTGMLLAAEAFGPIADNAGGMAEMSHLEPLVRERTGKLDSVGHSTAAVCKSYAIASAALTALALLAAFQQQARVTSLDLQNPMVMSGLFLGGMLPFLFSSMAMSAVGVAAMEMVDEVRRQFREIPGLLEGNAKPDTARCVDISTRAAIHEMAVPGLIVVLTPVVVGFTLGAGALGGLLAGVTISGVTLALFMSNAGSVLGHARRAFEGAGYTMENGTIHPRGSEAHHAALVGDMVGGPFRDSVGPSLNILVKLISVVALAIAPLLVGFQPFLGYLINI